MDSKNFIKNKLTEVFRDEPEELARILFCLREEENFIAHEKGSSDKETANSWSTLLDFYQKSPQELKERARTFANKTRDDSGVMEEKYKQYFLTTIHWEENRRVDEPEWKVGICAELTKVLQDDPDTRARVLFYLNEEDEKYSTTARDSPVWKVLKSAKEGSKVAFEKYLRKLAEETLQAEKDEKFKNVMDATYKSMLTSAQKCINNGQTFELGIFSSTSFPEILETIEAAKNYGVEKLLPVVTNAGVGKVELMSVADEMVSMANEQLSQYVAVGLAAVYLSTVAFKNIYMWWKGEISGRRCAKNIVDSVGKVGGGLAGGLIGARVGMIFGPGGLIIGGAIGSIVGTIAAGTGFDRWTQHLFDLPKEVSLERAYIYLGISCNATNDEVNAAFRKLCLKHHPDKGGDESEFLKLQSYMALIKVSRGETSQDETPQDEDESIKSIC